MWQFTAALLLALPAQKDNEAEKLFKDMEAKLNKAKAVSCTFEGKMEGPIGGDYKGNLVVAEGNKVRMEFNVELAGNQRKMLVVSDGKQIVHSVDGNAQKPNDTEKAFGEMVTAMTARGGVFTGMMMSRRANPDEKKDLKVDERFKLSAFKLGKKEKVDGKDAQIVEYRLDLEGQKDPAAQQVWVDTKTGLPLKRVVTVEAGGQKMTVTETYSKFSVDDKVEAKTFELTK